MQSLPHTVFLFSGAGPYRGFNWNSIGAEAPKRVLDSKGFRRSTYNCWIKVSFHLTIIR
jgi:hypothetical protein